MSAFATQEFRHGGFAVLRTPLLPLSALNEFFERGRKQIGEKQDHSNDDLRGKQEEFLIGQFTSGSLAEALLVASPSLHSTVCRLKTSKERQKAGSAILALARYYLRASYRSTPFGLFAGCTRLPIAGSKSELVLRSSSEYRRSTRVDARIASDLHKHLVAAQIEAGDVVLQANDTVRLVADTFHFMASEEHAAGRRYSLDTVERTKELEDILTTAGRPTTMSELVTALIDEEVGGEEARQFIGDLLSATLLVPHKRPGVTAGDPLEQLLSDFGRSTHCEEPLSTVETIRSLLEECDAEGLNGANNIERYAEILRQLPAETVKRCDGRYFHVDLYKPHGGASVGEDIVDMAAVAAETLLKITMPHDPLVSFISQFAERYGTREVPLLECIDGEIGLACDELLNPGRGERNAQYERYLLRLMADGATVNAEGGITEIVLDEQRVAEISRIVGKAALTVDCVAVVGTIVNDTSMQNGAEENVRLIVSHCNISSATAILGRFGHLDNELRAAMKRYIEEEEALRPDQVFAEVVYAPPGRAGNVVMRPALRKYEIPVMSRSGVSSEWQLPLSDLTLRLQSNRLRLRSRRLQRDVIPRINCAHNFAMPGGLAIYALLGHLQQAEHRSAVRWEWGTLAELPFLPRIRFSNVIFSLARWLIALTDIEVLRRANDANRAETIEALRSRRQLPRCVVLVQGDNLLPLDLASALCQDILCEMASKHDELTLQEMMGGSSGLVSGPEGHFANEVVVPFIRSAPQKDESDSQQRVTAGLTRRVPRTFGPGSEWVYVKLYTGPAVAERVLLCDVYPMIRQWVQQGVISGWFFIRYRDPDHHIRLRIKGVPSVINAEVIPPLEAVLRERMEQGALWRVQRDTYEREIERYGGDSSIELAEMLFGIDSDFVADTLIQLHECEVEYAEQPWRMTAAVAHVDAWLSAFGLSRGQRCSLLDEVLVMADVAERRRTSAWFRSHGRFVRSFLRAELPDLRTLKASRQRFRERASHVAAELEGLGSEGRLTVPVSRMLISFAHMTVNRVLRPANPQDERMCYDVLRLHHRSELARSRMAGASR